MTPEIIASILGALLTLLLGGAASSALIQKLIPEFFKKPEPTQEPYTERLADLTDSLTKASKEVDSILAELTQIAHDRQSTVQKLDVELRALKDHERELKEKIDTLEKTPLAVADHFA